MDRPDATRLLLVESRALVRAAMRCLLTQPAFAVVGEAATLPQALSMATLGHPDVVLLASPGGDLGVEVIPQLLAAAGPQARALVVADTVEPESHCHAIQHGAHGCVGTDQPAETLFKAIHKVAQGEVWLERRLIADLLRSPDTAPGGRARLGTLTRREREVASLVCQGLRNKQIAGRLTVTDVTVRHHLTSVFSKLGVTDRMGLLIFATRHGLAPRLDQTLQ